MGLGLALCVLTYRLLRREQEREHARTSVLTAIYLFMGLSGYFFTGALAVELHGAGFFHAWWAPERTALEDKVQAMFSSLDAEDYDAASLHADEILKTDPTEVRAFNAKGEIAFYSGDYLSAARHFESSLRERPGRDIILNNLADCYVELGRFEDAVVTYNKVQNRGIDWQYEVARAYAYSSNYEKALDLLKHIPTTYLRGRARVIEAVALTSKSNNESLSAGARDELRDNAKSKLRDAISIDESYWRSVLVIGRRYKHEGFSKSVEILGEVVTEAFNE